jgi:hypothetical protein
MKVEVYGKPYDQACQDAVGLLKSAKIKVKFYNTDQDYNRKRLIAVTNDLQKTAGYVFKSLENSPVPIVICDDTKEVLVGYKWNENLYDNILKKASSLEIENFMKKYPE